MNFLREMLKEICKNKCSLKRNNYPIMINLQCSVEMLNAQTKLNFETKE